MGVCSNVVDLGRSWSKEGGDNDWEVASRGSSHIGAVGFGVEDPGLREQARRADELWSSPARQVV
jgi:hypothetical protein